jgi:pimeloyl-ACP methyl ester carboxylesterase
VARIVVNGIELNVESQGAGETVLLLHGVPDSIALWRRVVPRLVAAGYRTVAIDQRGFGESEMPKGKRNYKLELLADDAVDVLDSLGVRTAHVVGHDWGSSVAWLLAGRHPDRFLSLTTLSLGHTRAYAAAGTEQLKRAWYILLVLIPWVGEWLVRARGWRLLRRMTNHPEADRWIRDLSRPGRLTACVNWYRANALSPTDHPNVKIPVLGVWSDGDFALTEAQMTGSEKFVDGSWRYQRIEGSSHWLPLDASEQLSELLLEFFDASRQQAIGPPVAG